MLRICNNFLWKFEKYRLSVLICSFADYSLLTVSQSWSEL